MPPKPHFIACKVDKVNSYGTLLVIRGSRRDTTVVLNAHGQSASSTAQRLALRALCRYQHAEMT
jgi:hypothetical protein